MEKDGEEIKSDAYLELDVSTHSLQTRNIRLFYATGLHILMFCYHGPRKAALIVPKQKNMKNQWNV